MLTVHYKVCLNNIEIDNFQTDKSKSGLYMYIGRKVQQVIDEFLTQIILEVHKIVNTNWQCMATV
jgi:hypothetical protein